MADATAHAVLFFSKTKLDVRAPAGAGALRGAARAGQGERLGLLLLK
jgi:hypothetical protein